MKKDALIDKYCRGKGLEIGGADNCVDGIDTLKVDNKPDYFHKKYTTDHILEATDLHIFEDNKFDFVITIHVLEHLANPIKALLEWNRLVKSGGFIFTAIPKKEKTFDRYRKKTPLIHILDDFRYDIGPLDATHIIEFNQFSVPAIYLEWKHEMISDEAVVKEITRFYKGEKRALDSEILYRLWRNLESEKLRHLKQIRDGIPLDMHYHVWESGEDVEKLLDALMLRSVEIVDDYLGNSILFVVKVDKNNPVFKERIGELRKGVYPSWVGIEDSTFTFPSSSAISGKIVRRASYFREIVLKSSRNILDKITRR